MDNPFPTPAVDERKLFAVLQVALAAMVLVVAYVLSSAPSFRVVSSNALIDAAVGRARGIAVWEFAYAPVRRLLDTRLQPALLGWADLWGVRPAFSAYAGRALVSHNLMRIGIPLHGFAGGASAAGAAAEDSPAWAEIPGEPDR